MRPSQQSSHATPADTVMAPTYGNVVVLTVSRMHYAVRAASSSDVCGSSRINSSPPERLTTSPFLQAWRNSPARLINTASPTSCPYQSLILLKWSISRAIAHCDVSSLNQSARRMPPLWLQSPVSGSVIASSLSAAMRPATAWRCSSTACFRRSAS